MVNPSRSTTRAFTGSSVLGRAMETTDVSVMLFRLVDDEPQIVWVNDAFTRSTGYSSAEVVGRGGTFLFGPATDPASVQQLHDLALDGGTGTVTLLGYRRDGSTFWHQVAVSTVPAEGTGEAHVVAFQSDVTEQMLRQDAQVREVEAERRARAGLSAVGQVSDLLLDLDDPHALREITRLLERTFVEWGSFYVNDNGLRHAEGIDPRNPPSGRGRQHGPRATTPVDDPAARAIAMLRADPIQGLLDATRRGRVCLDLSLEHDPGSASAWLAQDVRTRVAAAGIVGARYAHAFALPGRRRVLGLFVVVARAEGGRNDGVSTAAATDGFAGPGGSPSALPGQSTELESGTYTVVDLTARRVGTMLDIVRLYAREHRLAETLQRAMLPEQAEVRGLDVWSYYAPSADNAQVGGDWYDVLQASSDTVAIIIGDVVGHDVEAAAAMGQLRAVVRAYTYDLGHPGDVLERVDQVVDGMRLPRAASLALATLTRESEDDPSTWTVTYARAGHLPPMILRNGTVLTLDDGAGALVGYGEGPRPVGTARLEPGDTIVLYTDGLIERRDRSLLQGLAELVAVAGSATAVDAAGIGEVLLAQLAQHPEDDIAMVVARVPNPDVDVDESGLSPRRRRWLLPSGPTSIGRARHAVARTAHTWGIPAVHDAELVVSELVANAVMHGWGHVALRLLDTGDGLRIEVEDANPAPPVATEGHPGRIGGFGMQIVERLADWGWRPTSTGKLVWAKLRADQDDRLEVEPEVSVDDWPTQDLRSLDLDHTLFPEGKAAPDGTGGLR